MNIFKVFPVKIFDERQNVSMEWMNETRGIPVNLKFSVQTPMATNMPP